MRQSGWSGGTRTRLLLMVAVAALTLSLVSAAYGATLNVGAGKTYATIGAAISAATAGDTIQVYPGTYSEKNLLVNKSLTILGDPGDAAAGPAAGAPIIDGGGTVADAFDLANGVSNVTIRGFEIRNLGATGFTDGTGVGIQAWVPSTSNISVSDNWFHDVGYGVMAGNDGSSPSYALGTHTNWTVSNNIVEKFSSVGVELTDTSNSTVQGNVMHMMGGGLPYGQIGVFSWVHISQSGLTVSGNTIDGTMVAYPAVYMYAYDDMSPNPNLSNVNIANNLITTTGTPFQVYLRNIGTGTVTGAHVNDNSLASLKNLTAVSIDGTSNWWGQASGPGAGQLSGAVTTSPWISAYTNDPAKAGQPGFWPVIPVPVPTPASSTWSLVLAAIIGTGMIVWLVRKQGKVAA